MKKPVIGFAGLTHLGLNSAAASAARGFNIVGFHNDIQLVEQLNQGIPHVLEPQLPELMKQHKEQLYFSADINSLYNCDIVYIAVDVPTNDQAISDLNSVEEIIRMACGAMNKEAVLVVLCQVPPGFTTKLSWPKEQLFYQVETLIFGRAVDRALNPERFIVGCSDPAKPLPPKLSEVLNAFGCPVLLMKYESAELAKISINMFLVASVSTSNTLAEICEQIGANWFEIIPALRLDKRIGQHAYLNPGLGIAGGNLERDLRTILNFAAEYKTDGGIVASWIENSAYRKEWAWRNVQDLVLSNKPGARIGVLGLTYKENTHSIKNSPSIALVTKLANKNVTAYDPAAATDVNIFGGKRVDTIAEVLDNADVLIIMTPWDEFRSITAANVESRMAGRIVIDPYHMLPAVELRKKGFTYVTLGEQTQ